MSDNDMRPEPKKGFPGGFFLMLMATLLLIITFQNLSSEKTGQVSFSYQVEPLVNLDLIQPETAKMIAREKNDLVRFSGQFRDHITDEAKARHRYLELLYNSESLQSQQKSLVSELTALRVSAFQSSTLFLQLSGIPIPESGYVVVDNFYDYNGMQNAIVIKTVGPSTTKSLKGLNHDFIALSASPSSEKIAEFGAELLTLIQNFRSPALGIGNENIKLQLKNLEASLPSAKNLNNEQKLALYKDSLQQLSDIVALINTQEDGIRLASLRSVRGYKADLEQYRQVVDDLEKTTLQLDKARQAVMNVSWFFNNQQLTTKTLEKQDPEVFAQWYAQAKQEWDHFQNNKGLTFEALDQPRNLVLEKTFQSEKPSPDYLYYFLTLLPVLVVVMLLYMVFSRQMKGVNSGAMNFGKSPAKLLTKEKNKVTFKDVAGCDEAKEELQEIVEFLKDPAKFTALGARIPKGVLCIGAPGTGKTLIAKAVAGEADRPFFSISGSDFVEMFVGVGASRIRDLFDQARKHAPCIIFMDEIDAVGRHRGAGIGGGHDEREQTLNQLLVEMDGFDTTEGIILIAATNRPDVLDKALLRPGRFDRRIVIDLPDLKGRYEILKVHARKIKLDPSVDLMIIARNTPGSSGADLANILNEAALLAARRGRSAVTAVEAAEACDKVKYGKERRSLEIDQQEKKTTAYHESGHAMVALCVERADPVDKVTIIPRGLSLGATHFMPTKNRLSYWKKELLDRLAVLMGGRAAEELFIGDISSGAQMDITQATRLARSMVCEWGMNEQLGLVSYDERSDSGQYLGMQGYQEKQYSDQTAENIDQEVRKLLEEAHKRALDIVEKNREKVELMTQMLMEFETLDRQDVAEIMDGTWTIENKKQRVKKAEELQRKSPPPAPSSMINPGDMAPQGA